MLPHVVEQVLGGDPLLAVQSGPPGGRADQRDGLGRVDPEAGRGGRQLLGMVLEQVGELVEQDPAQGRGIRLLDRGQPLQQPGRGRLRPVLAQRPQHAGADVPAPTGPGDGEDPVEYP